MKGIDNICGKIVSEAQDKAFEIIEQAKKEAALFEDEQKSSTGLLVDSVAAAGAQKAENAKELKIKNAAMEAKRMTASKKQELIDKAFSSALNKLTSLPDDEQASLLARLAASACEDDGAGELVFNKKDRERLGEKTVSAANSLLSNGRLSLSGDVAPIKGGVIVKKGNIDFNCSFEVILRMLKEELSADVARTLFDKGE